MQTYSNTQLVYIEKKAVLEFCQGKRKFPFQVHPKESVYVEKHIEDFVLVPIKILYSPQGYYKKILEDQF